MLVHSRFSTFTSLHKTKVWDFIIATNRKSMPQPHVPARTLYISWTARSKLPSSIALKIPHGDSYGQRKRNTVRSHWRTQSYPIKYFQRKKSPELRVHGVNHKIITNLVWNSVTRIAQLAVTRLALGTRKGRGRLVRVVKQHGRLGLRLFLNVDRSVKIIYRGTLIACDGVPAPRRAR